MFWRDLSENDKRARFLTISDDHNSIYSFHIGELIESVYIVHYIIRLRKLARQYVF